MRWLKVLLVGVALAGMYSLGYMNGSRSERQPVQLTSQPPVPAPAQAEVVVDPNAGLPADFAAALVARDWDALVEQLEQAHNQGDHAGHSAMRQRMLAVATEFAEQDAPTQGVALLRTYIQLNPHDDAALFNLAELLAQQERYEQAIEPLLQILDFPRTVEIAERAAKQRDAYIEASAQQLAAQDPSAAVNFYQHLVERDPTNDQHRLQLARALVHVGQLAAADETLSSIAGYGVALDEVAELRGEVRMAAAGVPIERVDDALYADIEVNGERLRLLVDTGASTTVLDSKALAAVQARNSGRIAQLQTAGGLVQANVFEVQQLRFGELQLDTFDVVALDSVPGQTQGLLGMDLLNQVIDLGFQ